MALSRSIDMWISWNYLNTCWHSKMNSIWNPTLLVCGTTVCVMLSTTNIGASGTANLTQKAVHFQRTCVTYLRDPQASHTGALHHVNNEYNRDHTYASHCALDRASPTRDSCVARDDLATTNTGGNSARTLVHTAQYVVAVRGASFELSLGIRRGAIFAGRIRQCSHWTTQ